MKKIVILISGRGSNLQAILNTAAEQAWPAKFCAVISNNPGVYGLDVAQRHGIDTEVVNHRDFASRLDFDEALAKAIEVHTPDIVVLAGFLRVLGNAFVDTFTSRLINIHPSLLPSFPGLHTHRQALESGVRLHGATVHFVTAQLDHGPIIAQAAVAVEPGDDETSLAERVLQAEHLLFPRALNDLIHDRCTLSDGRVVFR